MKLHILFVRHGESADNVKCLYAGTRDSPLTVHGTTQAARLSARLTGTEWTRSHGPVRAVFSSPLQRAALTASAVAAASAVAVVHNAVLRERDYGLLEGRPYRTHSNVAVADVAESAASMQARAAEFVDQVLRVYIQATEGGPGASETVVIVSHGVFIKVLTRALRVRYPRSEAENAEDTGLNLNNTAFTHFCLDTTQNSLRLVSLADQSHLSGLKKTGGGIGNATFDGRQKTLDGFFKKQQSK